MWVGGGWGGPGVGGGAVRGGGGGYEGDVMEVEGIGVAVAEGVEV